MSAITERLFDIKTMMAKVGVSLKETERMSLIAAIPNDQNVRIAVEFYLPNLMHLRSSQAGQKQVMKSNGQIKKIYI